MTRSHDSSVQHMATFSLMVLFCAEEVVQQSFISGIFAHAEGVLASRDRVIGSEPKFFHYWPITPSQRILHGPTLARRPTLQKNALPPSLQLQYCPKTPLIASRRGGCFRPPLHHNKGSFVQGGQALLVRWQPEVPQTYGHIAFFLCLLWSSIAMFGKNEQCSQLSTTLFFHPNPSTRVRTMLSAHGSATVPLPWRLPEDRRHASRKTSEP